MVAARRTLRETHGDERGARAFSLVEVVLALAIFSFCLISMLALLPFGLTTASNAREQTAAAAVMEEVSEDIRDAVTNSTGSYIGAGVCTNLSWAVGGGTVTTNYFFSLGGVPQASAANSRLQAEVQVYPPASAGASGSALVSVVWPQQAKWNAGSLDWSNALGCVQTWVIFVPRP